MLFSSRSRVSVLRPRLDDLVDAVADDQRGADGNVEGTLGGLPDERAAPWRALVTPSRTCEASLRCLAVWALALLVLVVVAWSSWWTWWCH